MPASTLDPVNAAIRNSLSKSASETNLDVQLAGATKKALLADIEFEAAGSYQSTVLDKLKSKYIVLKSSEPVQTSNTEKMGGDETLSIAKHELFPLEAVQLGWSNTEWVVGAGMVNMGNTCYLNSTLQALFHVPALVNWLVSDKQHMSQCEDSGGLCIICAMRKTLQDSQQRNTNSIRPFLIFNKLRVVCRNLIPGRQEDAHEFLRYLVEAMEKAYLRRFKNSSDFDSRTKETTPLNQILGGYLRSAVRCLECGHVSTTFQHFQDLLLDIRKAQTVEEALDGYFSREKLDDESYHCESCQKKVPATKQFSLERAPMVLCIQLKRFSVSNNKITKHVQFRPRLELTKYARHRPPVPLVYRFVALVTHMGPTVGCGHYTAVAQAPCGNYYQFDDSMVRPISHQAVFNTNAYIMLYELECPPFPQKTQNNGAVSSTTTTSNAACASSSASPCSSGIAKANLSPTNAASTTNGTASCYSSNSITGGSAIAAHYTNNKQQHQDNTGSNHKTQSITANRSKLQLNGSRTIYGPELPSNSDVVTPTTTTAPAGSTTVTVTSSHAHNGTVSSSGNGSCQTRRCHPKKLNGNSLFSSSSSSSSGDSDSEQPQQKQQQQQAVSTTTSDGPHRNSEETISVTVTTTTSSHNSPHKCKSTKNSASSSKLSRSTHSNDDDDGGGGDADDAAVSPTRSCSSSSVSSLSSNVDPAEGSSPKNNSVHSVAATSATAFASVTTTTTVSSSTGSSRTTHSVTAHRLVPYDVDDDDEDEEDEDADGEAEQENEADAGGNSDVVSVTVSALTNTRAVQITSVSSNYESRVPTKATTPDWQVTSSGTRELQTPSNEGKSWSKKNKAAFQKDTPEKNSSSISSSVGATVNQLLKMSHAGYSAPVSSWNGTRAALDKEINEERREERKRSICDSSDHGRTKHVKTESSNYGRSNPGYNPLQEFHNAKNSWSQHNANSNSVTSPTCSSSSYNSGNNGSRQFYNTSGKHRNRRNNYHHKSINYHKNNYVFRQ